MTNGIIILGSARSTGNTSKIVAWVQKKTGFDTLDLQTLHLSFFNYDANYPGNDDFIPLMKTITQQYTTIIFATPVYWYSMSSIMKVFFDRLTDCLRQEKEIGRKLRGKAMGLISCGAADDLPEGFSMPFEQTANYLGMRFLGAVHTWLQNDEIPASVITALHHYIAENINPNN